MTLHFLHTDLQCLFELEKVIGMSTVQKYKDVLLNEFYLDTDDTTVRRAVDGWRGKWKQDDAVVGFKLCKHGYKGVHIPRTRTTVNLTHLILLLRGIEIPEGMVSDHLDGDTENNAPGNLRIVAQKTNCRNRKQNRNNTTGHNGITWNKASDAYMVRLYLNGTRQYLGQRKSLTDALVLRDSYLELRKQDGYTSRHGFEGATTIPQGSTLQANGSGSA